MIVINNIGPEFGDIKYFKGYRLIYMGKNHPAATLSAWKGYAYEHRIVWEAANGPLPEGYILHHDNEIRDDNRLENIILTTRRDHFLTHFPNGFINHDPEKKAEIIRKRVESAKKTTKRRRAKKESEMIECACGCGTVFLKYAEGGYIPRRYLPEHRGRGLKRDMSFMTPEHRKKLSDNAKSWERTSEYKKKMSESLKRSSNARRPHDPRTGKFLKKEDNGSTPTLAMNPSILSSSSQWHGATEQGFLFPLE